MPAGRPRGPGAPRDGSSSLRKPVSCCRICQLLHISVEPRPARPRAMRRSSLPAAFGPRAGHARAARHTSPLKFRRRPPVPGFRSWNSSEYLWAGSGQRRGVGSVSGASGRRRPTRPSPPSSARRATAPRRRRTTRSVPLRGLVAVPDLQDPRLAGPDLVADLDAHRLLACGSEGPQTSRYRSFDVENCSISAACSRR